MHQFAKTLHPLQANVRGRSEFQPEHVHWTIEGEYATMEHVATDQRIESLGREIGFDDRHRHCQGARLCLAQHEANVELVKKLMGRPS